MNNDLEFDLIILEMLNKPEYVVLQEPKEWPL